MEGPVTGVTVATVVLVVVWLVALTLNILPPYPGFLVASMVAAVAGILVGTLAQPDRAGLIAAVVMAYLALLALAAVFVGEAGARFALGADVGK